MVFHHDRVTSTSGGLFHPCPAQDAEEMLPPLVSRHHPGYCHNCKYFPKP